MADYTVYIIGVMIILLVALVSFSYMMEKPTDIKNVQITSLEYLSIADMDLWSSEEEWKEFVCRLCQTGKADHPSIGNITCPNYPEESCGCGISMKLSFETEIQENAKNVSCIIYVNNNEFKRLEGDILGNKNHSILIGLSDGAQINTKNTVRACCYSVCDSKTLESICD